MQHFKGLEYCLYKSMEARPYQTEACKKFVEHYYEKNNQRGILRMFCGTGKSYTSYMMICAAQERAAKLVLYITPRKHLISQFIKNIVDYNKNQKIAIYQRSSEFVKGDDDDKFDDDTRTKIRGKYDKEKINKDMSNKNIDIVLLITTYKTINQPNEIFVGNIKEHQPQLIIFDEAHTIGRPKMGNEKNETTRSFEIIDECDNAKIMFMTATPISDEKENNQFDMKNTTTYGEIFYNLKFYDAMSKKALCEYEVLFVDVDKHIGIMKKADFYGTILRWFFDVSKKSHRTIIYASTVKEATDINDKIIQIMKERNINNIETNIYTSKTSQTDRQKILSSFCDQTNTKQIIISVQALNEGVDLPSCDSVLFSYDKNCSQSTIVQNIGRALRIDKNNVDKKSRIYLPTSLNLGVDHCDGKFFKPIRKILSALNNEPNFYDAYTKSSKVSKKEKKKETKEEEEKNTDNDKPKKNNAGLCDISGTYCWDPFSGDIKKYDSKRDDALCEISRLCGASSIGNRTMEQVRQNLKDILGENLTSETFIELLSELEQPAKKRVLSLLYKFSVSKMMPCDGFLTYKHLFDGVEPTFQTTKAIINNVKDKYTKNNKEADRLNEFAEYNFNNDLREYLVENDLLNELKRCAQRIEDNKIDTSMEVYMPSDVKQNEQNKAVNYGFRLMIKIAILEDLTTNHKLLDIPFPNQLVRVFNHKKADYDLNEILHIRDYHTEKKRSTAPNILFGKKRNDGTTWTKFEMNLIGDNYLLMIHRILSETKYFKGSRIIIDKTSYLVYKSDGDNYCYSIPFAANNKQYGLTNGGNIKYDKKQINNSSFAEELIVPHNYIQKLIKNYEESL